MVINYLIDSNALIDYLAKKWSNTGMHFMNTLMPAISVITRIEVLGWYMVKPEQINRLVPFISYANIFPLDKSIILATIEIRKKYKIKTPDDIIAATALVTIWLLS